MLLRSLSTALPRLSSTHYDCLPDVSINRESKNDARKALNHFGIPCDSFKLRSNMCLSPGPIKYDKKVDKQPVKAQITLAFSLARRGVTEARV